MNRIYDLARDHYNHNTTLGIITRQWDQSRFGYSLEDTVRPYGIKVMKHTAIPEGLYDLEVRKSPKYGEVVVIFNRKNGLDYYLVNGGISFHMILAHGGNDHEDTEGCVLVNKTRDVGKFTAQGSLKEQLVKEIKELKAQGFRTLLNVVNMPQMG